MPKCAIVPKDKLCKKTPSNGYWLQKVLLELPQKWLQWRKDNKKHLTWRAVCTDQQNRFIHRCMDKRVQIECDEEDLEEKGTVKHHLQIIDGYLCKFMRRHRQERQDLSKNQGYIKNYSQFKKKKCFHQLATEWMGCTLLQSMLPGYIFSVNNNGKKIGILYYFNCSFLQQQNSYNFETSWKKNAKKCIIYLRKYTGSLTKKSEFTLFQQQNFVHSFLFMKFETCIWIGLDYVIITIIVELNIE